ncbi:MAG: DUF1667 domain-containing protein [Bacilli bacterium]
MRKYVCIVCPNGCSLEYDEVNNVVTGNKCKRGEEYARNEYTLPKRSVCSSVKTTIKEYPVISVRTDGEIEKRKINELLNLLKEVTVDKYLPIGSIVIKNVLKSGVNVITTTDMRKE